MLLQETWGMIDVLDFRLSAVNTQSHTPVDGCIAIRGKREKMIART